MPPDARMVPALRPCIAAAALLGLLSGRASADTVHVDPVSGSDSATGGATDPVRTLPVALARASAGDVIELYAGTHVADALLIDRSVTLRGSGQAATFLVPSRGGLPHLLQIAADDVSIEALTLRGDAPSGPRASAAIVSQGQSRVSVRDVDATLFSGDVISILGGGGHALAGVRVSQFGDRSGESSSAVARAIVVSGDAQLRGLTLLSGDAGVSVRSKATIEGSRLQNLAEFYVAFENGSGTVRRCTFEGADAQGSLTGGAGTAVLVRDLAVPGASIVVEQNQFARLGALTRISDGRVGWFEAPASVTIRGNLAYNLLAASHVAASATNGPFNFAMASNFVEYSPGIAVEDFLIRDGYNAFSFDMNTFRGYLALGDQGSAALRARFSQWDAQAPRTVSITATHAWEFATALDLEGQGLLVLDVTGDTRIRRCDTAVRVAGAGTSLVLESAHFHQNRLALDLRNREALVQGNAFEQDGSTIAAPGGTPAVFAGNWFQSYFGDDVEGLGFSPVPVAVAPGLTDLGPAFRYDRDLDGLPDVREVRLGLDPTARESSGSGLPDAIELFLRRYPGAPRTDTDGDLVPDVIDVGPFAKDFDQDGIADWYEMARGNDPRRADDFPPIGDVLRDGSVDLADAVRALQLINGTVPFTLEYGNLNELNVTGDANLRTLNQPLQIIRFQNGSRRAIPGLAGFD